MRQHSAMSDRLETVLAELAALKQRLPAEPGGLLPDLTGKRAYRVARERAEVEAVQRQMAPLQARKRQLLEDLRELSERIGEVEFASQEYEDALVRKERLLRESGDPRAVELVEIAERLADAEAELAEHDEACQAGIEAVRALHTVRQHLNSAHASATWGLLGSGAGHGEKHEHLKSAEQAGLAAQRALDVLRGKMARFPVDAGPRVSTPGALWSVDVFFDDFVTKTIRTNSIAETYDQMEEIIQWVSSLVDRLRPYAAETAEICAGLRARRRELLEPGG